MCWRPASRHAAGRLVLLLHGFPELAYSWRKVMQPLAAAGFRVVAPDQRGYGRTTGWDLEYDGDLGSFRILTAVRPDLDSRTGFRHREWQKCWRLINPGRKCGAKL